jgi:hypothetical protein
VVLVDNKLITWEMIVVTGSEREETQEDKIKGVISIPTHS